MPIKKFFAVFLCLIITITAAPLALRSETPAADAAASLALSNLAVPEEIGKVQERFSGRPKEMASLADSQAGSSPRTIIQIQDVHAHAIAQQNIAAILERLRAVFGIEKAALEGAWASTSLPKSQAIPTSREKQLLARTLLEDDRISGPVYAAIMSPEPITLIGIEDETFYEKNRALFLAHLGKTTEIDEKLRAYGASLQESQRSTWGPELLAFGDAFGKFRENSDLGKFFPVLWKASETRGVNASDLTQIALLRDIMSLERLFQKERLEQEVKRLMREYKNTPWTLEELIRGGKIPPEKLGFYPEIKKLNRLYQLRDQISLGDLMTQIEILTGRILGKLIRNPGESALWEKTERFYLARRILLLQASPEDMRDYEGEKIPLGPELEGAGLSEAFFLSLDFYEMVKKRDEIFFNRIVTDPALAGNVAVVTGGFHTDGLSQRFRDAGISYITITPELGGTPMNEKLYEERMAKSRGTGNEERETQAFNLPRSPFPASTDGQTLSELRNAIAWIDERFLEALKVLFQKKDVRAAANVFEGLEVQVSRADKITRLAAEGRLRENGGPGLAVPDFREQEFMEKIRPQQLEAVKYWADQAGKSEQKAMAVIAQSGIQKIQKELAKEGRSDLLERTLTGGDTFAVLQDTEDIPEILLGKRGVRRFPLKTVAELFAVKGFQPLRKSHPNFVIIQDGYRGDFVALPEQPFSLLLYRIIALNPALYQAALNPRFLTLLQELVGEILSQELPKKSV